MADIFLRNIDEALKQALRERAALNGRCMSAELREILRVALAQASTERNDEFKRLAAISRAMSADRKQTPSEVLLRKIRDGR